MDGSPKTFGSARRPRIDGLIYPLNSPVREVMRLASSRLFESGAVEYLVKKWEGNGVPKTSGGLLIRVDMLSQVA